MLTLTFSLFRWHSEQEEHFFYLNLFISLLTHQTRRMPVLRWKKVYHSDNNNNNKNNKKKINILHLCFIVCIATQLLMSYYRK